MKLLADEDIPQRIVTMLRESGHDVLDIKKEVEGRLSDLSVVYLAQKENRIIITLDKDFLLLLNNPKLNFRLIFLRLIPPTRKNIIRVIEYLLKNQIWKGLKHSATIYLVGDQFWFSKS